MFMSISSVPASAAPSVMICYFDVTLTPDGTGWTGTVSGVLTGTIEFALTEAPTIAGSVEHFAERSTITTTDGVVVKGVDVGVFNLVLGSAVSNGEVTEVSVTDWEWLVGWHIHLMGEADFDTSPMEFSGILMLMPSWK